MSKKAQPTLPHVLQDKEQLAAITKRLKRAHGQMGAVVRMIEGERSCEGVVMQMTEVGQASTTAALSLI